MERPSRLIKTDIAFPVFELQLATKAKHDSQIIGFKCGKNPEMK